KMKTVVGSGMPYSQHPESAVACGVHRLAHNCLPARAYPILSGTKHCKNARPLAPELSYILGTGPIPQAGPVRGQPSGWTFTLLHGKSRFMTMNMAYLEYLASEYWPHLALLLSIAVGGTAAVHAAMTKNDVRAAIGWVGIIMMSPLLGPFIYLIAGINRIRQDHISEQRNKSLKHYAPRSDLVLADIGAIAPAQFESLRVLGDRISHFPLCDGNHIQMLLGGDQTYPAMI